MAPCWREFVYWHPARKHQTHRMHNKRMWPDQQPMHFTNFTSVKNSNPNPSAHLPRYLTPKLPKSEKKKRERERKRERTLLPHPAYSPLHKALWFHHLPASKPRSTEPVSAGNGLAEGAAAQQGLAPHAQPGHGDLRGLLLRRGGEVQSLEAWSARGAPKEPSVSHPDGSGCTCRTSHPMCVCMSPVCSFRHVQHFFTTGRCSFLVGLETLNQAP